MKRNLNIIAALEKRGIHQYELASRCGLSETRLSRIIRGREQATAEEQLRIASALSAHAADLFPAASKGAQS
jgi:transcriptional regulator with XRE-family HTH domain